MDNSTERHDSARTMMEWANASSSSSSSSSTYTLKMLEGATVGGPGINTTNRKAPEQRVKMMNLALSILTLLCLISVSSVSRSINGVTRMTSATNEISTVFHKEERALMVAAAHLEVHPDDNKKTSSCADYRAYPWPKEHSGLPYLADVFTSDGKYVMFVGINRGACDKHNYGDDFHRHDSEGHRFMCMFNGHIPVISEFVAPSGRAFKFNFVFRCKIPDRVRNQIQPGQAVTSLHLDLHALHDLQQEQIGDTRIRPFPSQVISEIPKVPDIPICHSSPTSQGRSYNLTAYTRIKSKFLLNHYLSRQNQTVSPNYRVKEWIAYHQAQGFDHFVIYDNDKKAHGPIEAMLKPYVESGLVTYRWFPLEDCFSPDSRPTGLLIPYAQGAAQVAAFHRLGARTKFFASMDVDEFFLLYDGRTVLQFMNSVSDEYDMAGFMPTIIEYCDGVNVTDLQASPLAARKCITENHKSDQKLIMKPDKMLLFQVHYGVLTWNWTKPKMLRVDSPMGILAHYRGDPPLGTFKHDSPGGYYPFNHMDSFVSTSGTVKYPRTSNVTMKKLTVRDLSLLIPTTATSS